jgi:hypothetical protein
MRIDHLTVRNRLPERLCRLSDPNRIWRPRMDSNMNNVSKELLINSQDAHNEHLRIFKVGFSVYSAFWWGAFDPLQPL